MPCPFFYIKRGDDKMVIRKAKLEDLEAIAQIESICFPKEEAANKSQIKERLTAFCNHFFVAMIENEIVGFINGMVSDSDVIYDEMYENVSLHNENGKWQSIFGLDVLPANQHQKIATKLMESMIEDAKSAGREGLILTCKEHLVGFYETFGYVCYGKSQSTHGGAVWYDMRLTIA